MFDPDDLGDRGVMGGVVPVSAEVLGRMKMGSVGGMFEREFPAIESLDYNHDGRFLLSASMYGARSKDHSVAIALWDSATGCIYGGRNNKLEAGCIASSVRFHPRRDFDMIALSRDRYTGAQDHLISVPVETICVPGTDIVMPANVKQVLRQSGSSDVVKWVGKDVRSDFTLRTKLSSLEVSPRGDIVFTAGTENADAPARTHSSRHTKSLSFSRQTPIIYLWDVRHDAGRGEAIGRLMAPDAGIASLACDPTGLVFAFAQFHGRDGQCVRMYDIRKFTRGPFQEIYLQSHAIDAPYQLSFSPDGKYILTAALEETAGADVIPIIRVCSATHGTLTRKLSVPVPEDNANREDTMCDAGFTADSGYIYSGCADNSILFWKSHAPDGESIEEDAGRPACALRGHARPPKRIRWCRDRLKFASACYNVATWVPDADKIPDSYRDDEMS